MLLHLLEHRCVQLHSERQAQESCMERHHVDVFVHWPRCAGVLVLLGVVCPGALSTYRGKSHHLLF